MKHDEALRDLLALLPVSTEAKTVLVRRMSGSGRHYHGLDHLALLWRRHRRFGVGAPPHGTEANRLVACAIAYHDAFYDPRRDDNEVESARLWRQAADGAGLTDRQVAWVAGTIEATADHLGAGSGTANGTDALRLWVLDLDLTPLGETPERFAHNTEKLRAEFTHLDEASWRQGRRVFLAGLRRHARLYRTPALACFEAPARANIARELARLGEHDPPPREGGS